MEVRTATMGVMVVVMVVRKQLELCRPPPLNCKCDKNMQRRRRDDGRMEHGCHGDMRTLTDG